MCMCMCMCMCMRMCIMCMQRAVLATCSGVLTLADAWLSLMAMSSSCPACRTWSGSGPGCKGRVKVRVWVSIGVSVGVRAPL